MRPRVEEPFDWLNGDVRTLRERYARCFAVDDTGISHWERIEHRENRVSVLVQEPSRFSHRHCAIVYFHGGGWLVGSPSTHADISRALCDAAGLRLISVDYRLAPEHPAPAPVEDGLVVLDYLHSPQSGSLGCRRAILCGDSAGAGIALAVERQAEATVREKLLGVCSLYGGFGLLTTASLHKWGSREEGLDAACIERMWRLANTPGRPSPYSIESLAVASAVPVYLLAASRDPLIDDSLALAAALERYGRQVVVDVVEGLGHGFLHDFGASAATSAAVERICAWMRELP